MPFERPWWSSLPSYDSSPHPILKQRHKSCDLEDSRWHFQIVLQMDIWHLESQSKSACIETSPTYIQGTKFSSFHCMSLDKLLPRHTKENNSNQQPHFESKRIYPSQFLPSFPVFDHKVFKAVSVLKIVGPDDIRYIPPIHTSHSISTLTLISSWLWNGPFLGYANLPTESTPPEKGTNNTYKGTNCSKGK